MSDGFHLDFGEEAQLRRELAAALSRATAAEAERDKLKEAYEADDLRHRCGYSEAFNVVGYFADAEACRKALVALAALAALAGDDEQEQR